MEIRLEEGLIGTQEARRRLVVWGHERGLGPED
jgi:hypothetical protein